MVVYLSRRMVFGLVLFLGTLVAFSQDALPPDIQSQLDRANELSESQPEEGKALANTLLNKALESRDILLEAHARHVLGISLRKLGHYRSALEQIETASDLFKDLGEQKEEANTLNTLGLIHGDQGRYVISLQCHLRALELRKKVNDRQGLAYSYNNLGNMYRNTGEVEKSLEFHFLAIEMKKELGMTQSLAYSYNNIGHSFRRKGDVEKAREYYEKGLEIREQLGSKSGVASSLNNIGRLLVESGDYEGALKAFQTSLALREETNHRWGIAGSHSNIGNVLRKMGQFEEARKHLEKAYDLASEMEAAIVIYQNLSYQSQLYEDQGDYKQALDLYKLFFQKHESMFNERNSRQLMALQVEFETREKEAKARQSEERIRAEQEQRKLQQRFFIVILILFTLILGLLVHRFLFVSKARNKFKHLSEKLEEKGRLLEKANNQLKDLARLDGLTGILNRRGFDERFKQTILQSQRKKEPISVLMIDVDLFKMYNDHFGHQAGDECLKKVANRLSSVLKRPEDVICRYGGEEFAVVMGNTEYQGAYSVAESMRQAVEAAEMPSSPRSPYPFVTVSIGVCSRVPEDGITQSSLIREADHFLYAAKNQGRNLVVGEEVS